MTVVEESRAAPVGLRHRLRRHPAPTVTQTRTQMRIVAGQWVGGVGNLVFASILAHVLDPGDYGRFVAFLALYLLLHVPAAALSAAGAFAPARLAQLSRRVAVVGIGVGATIVVASGLIGALTKVPVPLVIALGLAAPGAGLLSLHRGLAYGNEEHRPVTASQLVEPAVRLSLGLVLAVVAGPAGAAAATVVAGYAALAVYAPGSPWAHGHTDLAAGEPRRSCSQVLRHSPTISCKNAVERVDETVPDHAPTGAVAVAVAFVLMAVLPAVDLLVANRVLEPTEAGRFGVLSTLGGAAIFATATIPLVLIPAAVRGRESAATTATMLTIAIGGAIALGGTLVAGPLLARTFGQEFSDLAPLVGPYLIAMALMGWARVQVARLAAAGEATRAAITVGVAVLVELVGVLVFGDSIGAIVGVTLFTAGALVVALELPDAVRRSPWVQALLAPRPPTASTLAMAGLVVAALVVRLATERGLWVDEAISVRQAQLPFGQMLADMRNTDVHPPLHHALLWVTVRVFGTSELAVRLPSLLAGAALIPVMGWVGRVLYDRRTGWVAAGLAAIAPFCVWYSQEARMYALFMLLAAVAVGAQVQAIRRGRTGDWVLYGVTTAAMLLDAVLRRAPDRRPAARLRRRAAGAGATTATAGSSSSRAGVCRSRSSSSPWRRCCRSSAASTRRTPTAARGSFPDRRVRAARRSAARSRSTPSAPT